MSKKQLLDDIRNLTIEKARRDFWTFCKVMADDFYTDDKVYLKELCDTLQAIYELKLLDENGKPYTKIMINVPPRFGKSRTLILFTQWCLGIERNNRIITASYNHDMASTFSRYTRDGIMSESNLPEDIDYNDIFPLSVVKSGDASYSEWSLEGEFFSYLGSGIGGSITGKGANITIVDDPIKNSEVAFNETALEKIWSWYTDTFLSRQEGKGLSIVCMTRWSKSDLCGKLLNSPEADKWYVFKREVKKDGVMLCESIVDEDKYNSLKSIMDIVIFNANYFQKEIDVQNKLYTSFKTYDIKPEFERIIAYVDTADTGQDFLCSLVAGIKDGQAYLLDAILTTEPMEVTESLVAEQQISFKVNVCHVESNNGGRGFARQIESIIWDKYNTRSVSIKPFHQSKNKEARILSNATYIMDNFYLPTNWRNQFPEYYESMQSFSRVFKANKHDDSADATTGLMEQLNSGKIVLFDKNLLAL